MEELARNYVPLPEPVRVTEQVWPEDTVPLVSTLTMAYMHERFIGPCIDGLLMQRTTFPVQFIIHEDASTDATAAIIREYEARYPRLIKAVYQQVNTHGRSDRRKLRAPARELIRGKYRANCEGDDYWTDPLKLQKQVDILEADPTVSGCFHYAQQFFEETGALGKIYGDHGGKLRFKTVDTFTSLALFHTSSFVFRISQWAAPPWLAKVKSGDMGVFALIASKGDLVCIPETMSAYRKHEGGMTQTSTFSGTLFHYHRILLWLFMDRHTSYRYTERCEELFEQHWKHIVEQATPRVRVRYVLRLMREVPGWFLRKPGFTLRRSREALQH